MREHLNYIADLKSRSALNAEYFCRKHVASARETLLRLIRVPSKQAAEILPAACCTGGFVAAVETYLACEGAVVSKLGVAVAGRFVHFVEACRREMDAGLTVMTIQSALNGAKHELSASVRRRSDRTCWV
jgi:hypothetical protein